ncbi:hypothetical protein LI031_00110 [Enterocloster citroniae]|uniref:hypothetical protein n=1 Tax=Enterocloster citroniae TaxID=358743 RepID=UPI001D0743BE|nr:hypothetical protein [Enterocloster citroniae]MCB7062229.1 hypothetical protein [Enterocloster citroniae]
MGLFGGGLFGGGLFGGSGSFGGYGGIARDPFPKNDPLVDAIINHVKENDDGIVGGILRISEEAKEEFTELLTDGFYEMVIKGNSDYKTSSEICAEANGIIYEQAERFKKRCVELNEQIENLNIFILELFDKKEKIAQKLDVRINKAETINSSVKYNQWTEPSYVESKSNINVLLRCIGFDETVASISDRKNSAKEYLNDAKDYEVCVSNKIAEMNRVSVQIRAIEQVLLEEQQILEALEESIRMDRHLQYDKIADQLHKMISRYVLEEDCRMNKTYVDAMQEIKRLCNAI